MAGVLPSYVSQGLTCSFIQWLFWSNQSLSPTLGQSRSTHDRSYRVWVLGCILPGQFAHYRNWASMINDSISNFQTWRGPTHYCTSSSCPVDCGQWYLFLPLICRDGNSRGNKLIFTLEWVPYFQEHCSCSTYGSRIEGMEGGREEGENEGKQRQVQWLLHKRYCP